MNVLYFAYLFTYNCAIGHVGGLQSLAIMNKGVNTCVQVLGEY